MTVIIAQEPPAIVEPQAILCHSRKSGSMALRFERYGRFWAIYEGDELLCVAVYKKGATAVINRIERGTPARRPSRKKRPEPPAS